MPTYRYKARDLSGTTHTGTLDAASREELANLLREQGRFLLDAEERRKRSSGARGWLTRRPSISRQELALFSLQLASALEAGVQILSALERLEEQAGAHLGPVLAEMRERIRAGASLSEAMSDHPEVFDDLFVNLVEAGEETGEVAQVLHEMADSLEWQEELAGEVRRLSIYPTVLLGAVFVVVTLLFNFVLPRLFDTLEELDVQLSALTRGLIFLTDLGSGLWWALPLAAGLLYLTVRLTRMHPQGRHALDALKLRLPVVGPLFRKIAISRFAHYLARLHSAGVGILRGLSIVEGVAGNAVVERAITRARDRIEMGSSLTEALDEEEVFPPLLLQMVSVGETAGSVDEGLERVAALYDREIPRSIEQIFALAEPLLILLLGAIVGAVALGVYLPIYSIVQTLGQ